MRILGLILLATAVATIDSSVRPWLPLMYGPSLVAVLATIMVTYAAYRHAYMWASMTAALLTDVLLGTPFAVRALVLLAAFVVVQPFVRTFRQQHELRSLLAIGVTITAADRLGVALGHPPETWAAWGEGAVLVWASATVWMVAVLLLLCVLRRRTILHATTPI